MSHQRKKTTIQDQMAASVAMENTNNNNIHVHVDKMLIHLIAMYKLYHYNCLHNTYSGILYM